MPPYKPVVFRSPAAASLPWTCSYETNVITMPWRKCTVQCINEGDAQMCARIAETQGCFNIVVRRA